MILKRVGGKSKLSEWIFDNSPSYRGFVDVFGGSGAVLDCFIKHHKKNEEYQYKGRPRYIYNDLDNSIYTFFKVLQNMPNDLSRLIELTPYSRKLFSESFENLQNNYENLSDIDKAIYLIVLNRQSYGSMMSNSWSTAINGEINYETWNKLPNQIMSCYNLWKYVYLENLDYKDLINHWDDETTLLYLDPPYEGVEYSYYNVNKNSGFNHNEMFDVLSNVKASFVVSYYGGVDDSNDTDLIEKYKKINCKVERKKVFKHLASGDEKSFAYEILLIKSNNWSLRFSQPIRIVKDLYK